jgi:hypothetical protein
VTAGLTGTSVGGFAPTDFGLTLLDFTGTVFSDDLLPIIQPDPADFDPGSNGFIQFGQDGLLDINNITIASTSVAVPEPGTLAVLGLGLAGLGFARPRRKT